MRSTSQVMHCCFILQCRLWTLNILWVGKVLQYQSNIYVTPTTRTPTRGAGIIFLEIAHCCFKAHCGFFLHCDLWIVICDLWIVLMPFVYQKSLCTLPICALQPADCHDALPRHAITAMAKTQWTLWMQLQWYIFKSHENAVSACSHYCRCLDALRAPSRTWGASFWHPEILPGT